jgi:hypothetical protein
MEKQTLFYVTIIGFHFLSAGLSYSRSPLNRPTKHAVQQQREVTNAGCQKQ